MNKLQQEQFKLGQDLALKGLRYTKLPKAVGGNVSSYVYRGYDEVMRITRCTFTQKHWNKPFGFKTSSDIKTLF